ncbi:cobalt ECF transporter T component CbiQ [Thermococcus sp.]
MSKLIDKTVEEVISFIREAVFSEEYAENRGLLQSLDPRVKLIALLISISVVVGVGHIKTLLLLYSIPLVMAALSGIPLIYFLKRVWVFIPIFTGIIAIPVIFNVITPGRPILVLWSSPYIAVTAEGLHAAVIFTLRVATAVSYAILLTITTKWSDVMKALSDFKVPGIVITITTLTYRYIFLLINILLDSMYSRKSRLCKKLGMVESWKEAGKNMGAVFIKTQMMGEDIYYAMLSRGYLHSAKSLNEFKFRKSDAIFLTLTILIMSVVFIGDRWLI